MQTCSKLELTFAVDLTQRQVANIDNFCCGEVFLPFSTNSWHFRTTITVQQKTAILSTELRRQRNRVITQLCTKTSSSSVSLVKLLINLCMSTKFIVIENPRRTVSIQIAFEKPSLIVVRKSRNIFHTRLLTYADLMLTRHVRRIGVADKQTQHGKQRVDAKIHYRTFSRGVAGKRSVSTEFILQSRRRPFCHDPARSRFQIRR